MGANRRYGDRAGEQIARRIEQIGERSTPVGLTDAELQTGPYGVSVPRAPLAVRAWVRFASSSAQLDGFAVAWTSRAVLFEWLEYGRVTQVWVWASAVELRWV